MATINERTGLVTDYAESADYRTLDWNNEEILEATFGARCQWQRTWGSGDQPDGATVPAAVARFPPGPTPDTSLAGVGTIRYLKIELEPSAAANTDGVELRTDPAIATGFWLRSPSATQKGLWILRGMRIVTGGSVDGAIYLRAGHATRITVKVTALGDAALGS